MANLLSSAAEHEMIFQLLRLAHHWTLHQRHIFFVSLGESRKHFATYNVRASEDISEHRMLNW